MRSGAILILLMVATSASSFESDTSTSTPKWLPGTWSGSMTSGTGPDNKYTIEVSLGASGAYAYMIRGGVDPASNTPCRVGWVSTYTARAVSPSTVLAELAKPLASMDVRRTSNACLDHYFKIRAIPGSVTIELTRPGEYSHASFSGRPFSKKPGEPVRNMNELRQQIEAFVEATPARP